MKNLLIALLFLLSLASCRRDIGTPFDSKSLIGKELVVDSVRYTIIGHDGSNYLTDKQVPFGYEFVRYYFDSLSISEVKDTSSVDTPLIEETKIDTNE